MTRNRFSFQRAFLWGALIFLIIAFAAACAKSRPSAPLPATWIWDQDQDLITPADGVRNAWNGWTVDAGAFEAQDVSSRFIIWRRSPGKHKLSIVYTLTSQPASLSVNTRKKTYDLQPAAGVQQVSFDVQLQKGMNILQFRKAEKDRLRIMSLAVDRPHIRRREQLRAGESVSLFLPAGQGRIELVGRGSLTEESSIFGPDGFQTETQVARTRFLGRRVVRRLRFIRPGLLTLRINEGLFSVGRFAFEAERPPLPEEPPRRMQGHPPIFLICIDGCQAKHLRLFGYPRPTSPNIERLARDGVAFEQAYANATYTRLSIRSLLTGNYPQKAGAKPRPPGSRERLLMIPEFLKAKGYRTSIFTSAVMISPNFGFTEGIDDYFSFIGSKEKGKEREIDLDRFSDWLKKSGPLYSYVHFIEPHMPIVAPPPFLDMFKSSGAAPRRDRLITEVVGPVGRLKAFSPEEVQDVIDDYDSTIAYIDSVVGKTIERIREAGLYEDALIVFFSDHGEAMYEHNVWGHSANVFDETAHAVLVVKFPASLKLTGRVVKPVQHIDIFPTLVELFGQKLELPGTSLIQAIRHDVEDDRMAVSQAITEMAQFGMRWRNWYAVLYLKTNRLKLYNLAANPFVDVSADVPCLKTAFMARFLDWWKDMSSSADEGTEIDVRKLTPAEVENLKSLGYL